MTRMKLTPGDVEYHYTISEYASCTVHLMVGEAWGHAAAASQVVETEGPLASRGSDTGLRADLELAVYDKLYDSVERRHRATTRPHDIL